MTVIKELIVELENIKLTKCKTLQEVVFFDGVLAIIEGKYLEKEKESFKELVEVCRLALHFCDRLRPPTEHELEALRVDLIRALVKYS